jgi:hypothetical protein
MNATPLGKQSLDRFRESWQINLVLGWRKGDDGVTGDFFQEKSSRSWLRLRAVDVVAP